MIHHSNRPSTRKVIRIMTLSLAAGMLLSACSSISGKRDEKLRILEMRENVPPPYVDPAVSSERPALGKRAADSHWETVKPPVMKIEPVQPVVVNRPPPPLPQVVVKPEPIVQPVPVKIVEQPRIPLQTKTHAPPPPLPDTSKVSPLKYTVKKGDTLWDIARSYGVTTKELAAENNLKTSDILKIDTVLVIPPGGKFVPLEKRPMIAAQPSPASGKARKITKMPIPQSGKHIVKKGDTLWDIGRIYGIDHKKIKQANNLKSDMLHPGQVLVLTEAKSASQSSRPPVAAVTTTPSKAPQATPNEAKPEIVDKGERSGSASPETTVDTPATATDVQLSNLPHYVSDGDTLQSIAEMYGSKTQWILKENPGISEDADLKEGIEIQVPCPDLK